MSAVRHLALFADADAAAGAPAAVAAFFRSHEEELASLIRPLEHRLTREERAAIGADDTAAEGEGADKREGAAAESEDESEEMIRIHRRPDQTPKRWLRRACNRLTIHS